MRRALNVLQACHAAYDEVDEAAVYNCTGNPHPKDVESMVQSMLRDEFGTSYECEQLYRRAVSAISGQQADSLTFSRYHKDEDGSRVSIAGSDRWHV
jgi:DNA polymerase III delta prime subunit